MNFLLTNSKKILTSNNSIIVMLKVVIVYILLCGFNYLVIGLASPSGRIYSPFVHNYLDYISFLRCITLISARSILNIFGSNAYIVGSYILRIPEGLGIKVVYSCIGYGIMSFWVALVVSFYGSLKFKFFWISFGIFAIYLINICRIIVLILVQKSSTNLFTNIDHHLIFNIISYLLIIGMIYIYNKTLESGVKPC